MRFSARLQLLACLMVYVTSAHAIMVKFGTKEGPIEPPAPEPAPKPRPYRNPAPVWEERSNDTPDPNAQWRPPFFVPQPRYTNIAYNINSPPSLPVPVQLSNARRFVNAYLPVQQNGPAILGSQSLPGIGLRYFYPVVPNKQKVEIPKTEDAKLNHVDTNDVAEAPADSASDIQWKYEKDATRRNLRSTLEGSGVAPQYHWPVFVPSLHY